MRKARLMRRVGAVAVLALAAAAAYPKPPGAATRRSESSSQTTPPTAQLERFVRGAQIERPEPTPVPGIFRVRIGSGYVYLTADGRHAFTGDLFDLSTGENLTETRRNGNRLASLAQFPAGELVLFPAEGVERARVHVFTDSTCPYCRKLHQEVPALRKAGVTIAYIPFPRGGEKSPGYRELRSVWCAEDRAGAFDIATGQVDGQLGTGDCPAATAVDAGYRLGVQLGVSGTPTVVLPSGAAVPVYVNAPTLLARLGLGKVSVAP